MYNQRHIVIARYIFHQIGIREMEFQELGYKPSILYNHEAHGEAHCMEVYVPSPVQVNTKIASTKVINSDDPFGNSATKSGYAVEKAQSSPLT